MNGMKWITKTIASQGFRIDVIVSVVLTFLSFT